MILQMLSNAEFLFTNKTLVRTLAIMDVHVICKFYLTKEFHGADFAVKHCPTLLTIVLFSVNPVTFCLCERLETVVASMKGSVSFHWLHIMHSSMLP